MLRVGGKSIKYWLFAIFWYSDITQDEETSLEQISRQKIVEQIGFPASYKICENAIFAVSMRNTQIKSTKS